MSHIQKLNLNSLLVILVGIFIASMINPLSLLKDFYIALIEIFRTVHLYKVNNRIKA